MTKAISFQYDFVISRNKEGQVIFDVPECLADLSFGFDVQFRPYLARKQPHFEANIFDYGADGFPTVSISLTLIKATANFLNFQLEVTAVPSKLIGTHRMMLERGLEKVIDTENFKIWWDNDPRGARKRSSGDKKKILETIKEIPVYDGSSDLKLEDIEITVPDALEFFGFSKSIKAKELKKVFKGKFRELQLKYHPDSDTGDESIFMHLQNCREVLDGWMKRG